MNGLPPTPGGLWQEARAGDGRVYYYNTVTKATQWTKPEEMMTPQEVCAIKQAVKARSLTVCLARPCESTVERVYDT
jgi:hypothetical protein